MKGKSELVGGKGWIIIYVQKNFILNNSTPLQTWVATQIIKEINLEDKNHLIIKGILNYLAALLALVIYGIIIFRGDISVGVYISFSLYITTLFGGIQAFVGLGAIVKPVCVNIKDWEKIILKGNNGAGKSTLIKLILGLYEPKEGMIFINGLNIIDINKSILRIKIVVVSQKIILFKGTVLDNILLGTKDKNR